MGYINFMYSKTTNGVTVTVTPYFLDDQSSPQESHFVWAYQVNIKNSGNSSIKLNHRNWLIIDANGKIISKEELIIMSQLWTEEQEEFFRKMLKQGAFRFKLNNYQFCLYYLRYLL